MHDRYIRCLTVTINRVENPKSSCVVEYWSCTSPSMRGLFRYIIVQYEVIKLSTHKYVSSKDRCASPLLVVL